MTPKEQSAMQQALEALEVVTELYDDNAVGIEIEAITALREALAEQSEQEPVAWGVDWGKDSDQSCVSIIKKHSDGATEVVAIEYSPNPVRTKDLTKTEMLTEAVEAGFMLHTGYGQGVNKMMPVSDSATLVEFARAVIAAFKEKNK